MDGSLFSFPKQETEKAELASQMEKVCRESIAIYNCLDDKDRGKIPDSLIEALCHYAGIAKAENVKPATNREIFNMSGATNAILQLFFYYSGTSTKKEAMAQMKRMIGKKGMGQGITSILRKKKEIEESRTGV